MLWQGIPQTIMRAVVLAQRWSPDDTATVQVPTDITDSVGSQTETGSKSSHNGFCFVKDMKNKPNSLLSPTPYSYPEID